MSLIGSVNLAPPSGDQPESKTVREACDDDEETPLAASVHSAARAGGSGSCPGSGSRQRRRRPARRRCDRRRRRSGQHTRVRHDSRFEREPAVGRGHLVSERQHAGAEATGQGQKDRYVPPAQHGTDLQSERLRRVDRPGHLRAQRLPLGHRTGRGPARRIPADLPDPLPRGRVDGAGKASARCWSGGFRTGAASRSRAAAR